MPLIADANAACRVLFVKTPRFLAELSVRAKTLNRVVAEPIGALIYRICGTWNTPEGPALATAFLALIECEGDISEAQLNALSPDSLALLDTFATNRLRLKYDRRQLNLVAMTVREMTSSYRAARALGHDVPPDCRTGSNTQEAAA